MTPNRSIPLSLSAMAALLCALLLWPGTAKASQNCELCHRYPGLESQGRKLTMDKRRYAATPHAGLICEDCHKGHADFPHSMESGVRCDLPCHVPGATHGKIPEIVSKGPHARIGREGTPPCLPCHDDRSVKSLIEEGPDLFCLRCHDKADPVIPYYPFTAGSLGRAAHARLGKGAPGCTACHDRHSPEGDSARRACLKQGCHEGASPQFSMLYDHGGGKAAPPLARYALWLLWGVAALLLLQSLRGRGK